MKATSVRVSLAFAAADLRVASHLVARRDCRGEALDMLLGDCKLKGEGLRVLRRKLRCGW